jgi:hypothetical protein
MNNELPPPQEPRTPEVPETSELTEELADVIPIKKYQNKRLKLLIEALKRHPAHGKEPAEETLTRLGIELTDDDDLE